ncbi:MAG: HD domain-containing protein [Oscillospiraceae bacterium]|nr:HD domain-containing protein [Oscillospiraceae bacterium]
MIEAAKRYIENLFAGDSGGHDAAHTLRVYRNAMRLADALPDCDRETVALAALLHDADDPKLFKTENLANARAFLASQNADPARIEAVCRIIDGVSFSKNGLAPPTTLEGRIVQDADRLDALGAVGIARTFAYGGAHGRTLDESVKHFHEKLLHLADGLNTSPARELARERHEFLLQFLRQYEEETR